VFIFIFTFIGPLGLLGLFIRKGLLTNLGSPHLLKVVFWFWTFLLHQRISLLCDPSNDIKADQQEDPYTEVKI